MTSDFTKSIKRFIAGGIAGAVAKTAIAPLDRVKILFMTNMRTFTYTKAKEETIRILRDERFLSFWKGNMAQLWRIVPYTAI
jgi:hypothetical protein